MHLSIGKLSAILLTVLGKCSTLPDLGWNRLRCLRCVIFVRKANTETRETVNDSSTQIVLICRRKNNNELQAKSIQLY